jgi:glucose-1-phosphate adenylyltransferase
MANDVAGDHAQRERGRLARDTTAVVLAGGRGTRLGPLTRRECKPALPFGGCYRTIDFSLSNCVNSGIDRIGVPTQYRDASLVRHLEQAWLAGARASRVRVDAWRAAALEDGAGYRGTADAVRRNWPTIDRLGRELVLILAGDHVYRMDYRPMLARHLASGADVTVGCVDVPIAEASQFGVMAVDDDHWVRRFAEKPTRPESMPGCPGRALGSMGIYVFGREFLGKLLAADAAAPASTHDFGHDVIPALVGRARVMAYPFTEQAAVGSGYWRDVGTVAAYWRAHMELLDGVAGMDLFDPDWPVLPVRAPARAARAPSRRDGSLLAHDSDAADAYVKRSVVYGGARIEAGSEVINSVVLPGAVVDANCRLAGVIVAAGARVPAQTVVEPAPHRFGIIEPVLLTGDTKVPARALARDGEHGIAAAAALQLDVARSR